MGATISLCMIVRDEEAMLADCLRSVQGAVDDRVIVDTGSRDATKKVAAEGGARVFDFVWCDDFAAARNEALRHARGDWVLVLDADERLGPGSAERLRAAVAQARFDCGMLRLHDAARIDAPFEEVLCGRLRQAEIQLVPRLLRRAGGLKFVDAIHENVAPWLRRRGTKVAPVDVDIIHLGATKQVVDAKAKAERNIRLLQGRIERDPADVVAHGYLAHDLLRSGLTDEAFDVVERGWARALRGDRRNAGISLHRLATARAYLLLGRGRFAEARDTVRHARSLEGDNPDFVFFEASCDENEALRSTDPEGRRAFLERAHDGYARCLAFADQVFSQSFVFGASTWCGATRLGTVQLLLGRPAEALLTFDRLLPNRPKDRAIGLGRVEALLDGGSPGRALGELEPWLDDASPDAWVLAAIAVHALEGQRGSGRRSHADDARLFATRAGALASKGFVAPHRRERLRGLVERWTSASEPGGRRVASQR